MDTLYATEGDDDNVQGKQDHWTLITWKEISLGFYACVRYREHGGNSKGDIWTLKVMAEVTAFCAKHLLNLQPSTRITYKYSGNLREWRNWGHQLRLWHECKWIPQTRVMHPAKKSLFSHWSSARLSFCLAMHNPGSQVLRQEERGRMVVVVKNRMLNQPGQTDKPASSPPLNCYILSFLPHSMLHGGQGICTIKSQEAKHWLFFDIICWCTDNMCKPPRVLKHPAFTHKPCLIACCFTHRWPVALSMAEPVHQLWK